MSILGKFKKSVVKHKETNEKSYYKYFKRKYFLAEILHVLTTKKMYAKLFYRVYTGKKLNLINPVYYDEKIWWLKLNYQNDLMNKFADKIEVKKQLSDLGLESIIIPDYGYYNSVAEIDLKKIADEVIIKCGHNSGGHVIYDPNNRRGLTKYEIKRLNYLLKKSQYKLSLEWAYKNIPHRLIVEKVIRNADNSLPNDYKFMCFGGKVHYLFYDQGVINEDGSSKHDYHRNIYDVNFRLLPVKETRDASKNIVQKPVNFEKMVEIAEIISKPFPHCRVDLYNIEGKIYFGEVTFYHGGGCNDLSPETFDRKMGDLIDITLL